MTVQTRFRSVGWALVLAAALAGCAGQRINQAPVEDRGGARPGGGSAVTPTQGDGAPVVAVPAPAPKGIENAGKPGYYAVKPGDTLTRIALDHGQVVADLVRWNKLDNPNRIEVGQVLRVEPPEGEVVVKPVTQAKAAPVGVAGPPVGVTSAPADAKAAPAAADGGPDWAWPAAGAVLAGFDEAKNKGLDIGGAAGDPVLAAADGRVVYVGSSLRGYGNLVIIKHNNVFLTAYAHNKTLLVKEDQPVKRGQKIAEMGSSDTDRVKLHFEIRRQGKPVDPAKYLPTR